MAWSTASVCWKPLWHYLVSFWLRSAWTGHSLLLFLHHFLGNVFVRFFHLDYSTDLPSHVAGLFICYVPDFIYFSVLFFCHKIPINFGWSRVFFFYQICPLLFLEHASHVVGELVNVILQQNHSSGIAGYWNTRVFPSFMYLGKR